MGNDVKEILLSQTDLYTRLARCYENFKKTGKSSLGIAEARLQTLEQYWVKFEARNDKLFAIRDTLAGEDYFKLDIPSLAEEAYLDQKGLFLDTIHALRAQATTTTTERLSQAPRTTLPRIQLPSFSGKYEDWPAFRDLFQSIIGRDASTSTVEKLHYLKTCLKGEAELLVRNLATTGNNYETAWRTLQDYYENKRLLTRAYLSSFLALQKMKSESAVELRKIFHGIKATVSSLESIGRPVSSSEDLFVFLAVELLDPRSRREWETSIGDTTSPPPYSKLERFLDRRLHTLEAMLPVKPDSAAVKTGAAGAKATRSHHARKQEAKTESGRSRCPVCQADHFVMFCEDFKRKTAADRKQFIADNNMCGNCLGRHKIAECSSKKNCTACGGRHHTSLHDAFRDIEPAKTSHVAQRPPKKTATVLLATARVRVADRQGDWHLVRALIDQGSESSIVTERLAQRLKLPRSSAPVAVYGVGGLKTGVAKGRISLRFRPRNGGTAMIAHALVLPRLTVYAGGINDGASSWPHLRDLELADPDFQMTDPIDLLLGADVYAAILGQGLRKGSPREPVAQQTALGWILSGVVGESSVGHHVSTHQCRTEEDLVALVRLFWETEEISLAAKPLSRADLECEEHFLRTHSRTSDGRYMVRLPTVEPMPDFSSTKKAAVRMLKQAEKRFEQDDNFRAMYTDFLRQYTYLGHMTEVPSGSQACQPRACYLPHHGVLRETSASTKLRVVFNGSSTLPTGENLNRFLQIGPNLLPALADTLQQWRQYRYVFASDIEKMYRQILVHPEDRSLQQIMWREHPREDMREFKLNTVTYGLSCAPYLAIRTLRQLAFDEGQDHPQGAEVLLKSTYMDDILAGAATISEAQEIRRQLSRICTAGCFPLKKWSANHLDVLKDVPVEDCLQQEPRGWKPGESHATLGLHWQPCDDLFTFSTQHIELPTFSKRAVLSLTAKLFDPLGWLSPTTVLAKIYIQSTWLLGVDWDTPLPEDDVRRWTQFQNELRYLEKIRIPRWLGSGPDSTRMEIHGFADASARAYAAVVYLRTEKDGVLDVRLVAAKTKVAPLKQISLPRLELSAATLLTRLVAHLQPVIGASKLPLHLWSDSTVTLGWIRGHPASWTTYVANRVSEIQTTLPDAVWHHVPGRENPADCASRGIFPSELENHPLWWQGPPWLREETGSWAACPEDDVDIELPERRARTHLVAATLASDAEEAELLVRFSSLQRLLRITAWCRRWLRGRGANQIIITDALVLGAAEIDEARKVWVRQVQAASYEKEIRQLSRSIPLSSSSNLSKLTPYLDETGLLRVGGRLRHARLANDVAHPIILPSESALTRLVVEAHHRRTLHGGTQLTLCSVRQEYWIPRGRAVVKSIIRRCLPCLRWRAAIQQPPMGDLPAPRVTPSRPFLNTGLDYAGPVWLRSSKGRGHKAGKAFIAVFICLSSRAVHLDVVSNYSADAFLAALRRFVSRRGLCRSLYSDCGTNFLGADKQLRGLFSAASREGQRIAAHAAEDRIRWHFNPPAAPHFGGIWEAAVKSMKFHLRRVIGDATLTYEEMATLLAQVEACLNSRPLQALSDDPEDVTALTPGHFLVGSALTTVPEPSLAEASASRLSRWQLLQQMRDHFWNRWAREYLHTLAHRPKWSRVNEEASVGRLCLLRSETTPPAKWPLARVTKVHPGADGHIRVVSLRTANSSFTRPVVKLVLLPWSTDPEVN